MPTDNQPIDSKNFETRIVVRPMTVNGFEQFSRDAVAAECTPNIETARSRCNRKPWRRPG